MRGSGRGAQVGACGESGGAKITGSLTAKKEKGLMDWRAQLQLVGESGGAKIIGSLTEEENTRLMEWRACFAACGVIGWCADNWLLDGRR
jgi:hypothetical protein